MQQSGFFSVREEGRETNQDPPGAIIILKNFGETKVCLCLLLITLGPTWYICTVLRMHAVATVHERESERERAREREREREKMTKKKYFSRLVSPFP